MICVEFYTRPTKNIRESEKVQKAWTLINMQNFKNEIKLTPQSLIKNHENNLLRFEQGIIQANERMRIINSVLLQRHIFYKESTLKRSQCQIELNTRDFLLKGSWRKILAILPWKILKPALTMAPFREMFCFG